MRCKIKLFPIALFIFLVFLSEYPSAENILESGDPFAWKDPAAAANQSVPPASVPTARPPAKVVPPPSSVAVPRPTQVRLSPYSRNLLASEKATDLPGVYGKKAPSAVTPPPSSQPDSVTPQTAPPATSLPSYSRGSYHAEYSGKVCRIGVFGDSGLDFVKPFWESTQDYLSRELPGIQFELITLNSVKSFETASETPNVDFLIVDPAGLIICAHYFGISGLATLETNTSRASGDETSKGGQGASSTELSGVIFCRANDKKFQDISDIEGKPIVALNKISYASHILQVETLQDAGIDAQLASQDIVFAGTAQKTISAVLEHSADVGFLSRFAFEYHLASRNIKPNTFKVLDKKTGQFVPVQPLPFSTAVGPNWAFVKTKKVSNALAAEVQRALLRFQPPAGTGEAEPNKFRLTGWTVFQNYRSVEKTMRQLYGDKMIPGEKTNFWDKSGQTKRIIFWLIFIIILLLVGAILLFYNTRATHTLLEEKNNDLQDVQVQLNELRSEHKYSSMAFTVRLQTLRRQVRDTQHYYRTVFNSYGIACDIFDKDTKLIYADPATVQNIGPINNATCSAYYSEDGKGCENCPLDKALNAKLNVQTPLSCPVLGDFQTFLYADPTHEKLCARMLSNEKFVDVKSTEVLKSSEESGKEESGKEESGKEG